MAYTHLLSSESVSAGHPDKVGELISGRSGAVGSHRPGERWHALARRPLESAKTIAASAGHTSAAVWSSSG